MTPVGVTAFRSRLREIVRRESSASPSRDIIVFAIDGIPAALAQSHWDTALVEPMRAVFPTTSSTGWLSALTGLDVAEHGVPGVVFRTGDGREPVNVFEHRGRVADPMDTIFTDARRAGYRPVAVVGDLADYRCAWRELLLCGAQRLEHHRFYTGPAAKHVPADRPLARERLRAAIRDARNAGDGGGPRLVWCFADVDRHVHRHGYDGRVEAVLDAVQDMADELSPDCVVVAHSDHGLVATKHDPRTAQALATVCHRYAIHMGGAGRCRWLYADADQAAEVIEMLVETLPADVAVGPMERWFPAPGRAAQRIGRTVVVAEGTRFLTPPGYAYDHGSLMDEELSVPFATWPR
jgi:hypothetical protein